MASPDNFKQANDYPSYSDVENPNRRLFHSFKDAFAGLLHTLKHERNFRIHTAVTVIVLIAGAFFQLRQAEWLAIMLSIGLVLSVELLNTAIESTIDIVVGEQYHPLAKIAKDVAAAAVILTASLSVIIGMIIFIPYLWNILLNAIN